MTGTKLRQKIDELSALDGLLSFRHRPEGTTTPVPFFYENESGRSQTERMVVQTLVEADTGTPLMIVRFRTHDVAVIIDNSHTPTQISRGKWHCGVRALQEHLGRFLLSQLNDSSLSEVLADLEYRYQQSKT